MEYSLPAWLGALAGTVVAVAIYVPAIRAFETYWRAQKGPTAAPERAEFEGRLSLLRRSILAADIALLATAGYWIGNAIGASGAPQP